MVYDVTTKPPGTIDRSRSVAMLVLGSSTYPLDHPIWKVLLHSCGHDIHMASWVGTAKTLVVLKDQWHGTLMFIAQPAEETGSGAKAMLADGLFTRFKQPDFAFSFLTGPLPYRSSTETT